MPDRISRTHVVPGNIMSVEFKLFDIMTLKQFLYLVGGSFISYLLISLPILPDGILKFIFPAIIMISGIIIAFVQFNGEPFEVYTSNFILGVIQPQRRVWSKTPIKRAVNIPESDGSSMTKALKSLNENYVAEEEVLPIDYNKAVTDMDLQESKFLKSDPNSDIRFMTNSSAIPKSDLSKLNFNFALQEDAKQNIEKVEGKNLIELKDVNLKDNSAIMDTNEFSNLLNAAQPGSREDITLNNVTNNSHIDKVQNDINLNSTDMPNNSNSGNVHLKTPAFVIDMDDDKNEDTNSNSNPPEVKSEFIPLAKDLSQEDRANNLPDVNLNINSNNSEAIPQTNISESQQTVTQPSIQTETNPIITEEANIHGRVISADKTPSVGAVVTLCDDFGKAMEANITDENGFYKFQVQPKTFQLKVYPPKNYLFSPMDKFTKEITIYEVDETAKASSNNISSLPDALEINSSDSKIPNTINGSVKDEENHYIPGVLVSIKDESGNTIRALATNPLGQFFSLSPLPNGKYHISLEKDGYSFIEYTVDLEGKMYNAKVYGAHKK